MKYVKKPVVIEALKFDGTLSSYSTIAEAFGSDSINCVGIEPDLYLNISTMEGVMVAMAGDYIIKGVIGELYPCKPEVFHATYSKVEE